MVANNRHMSDVNNDKPLKEHGKNERDRIGREEDDVVGSSDDSFPASDPVSIVTSHEEEDWGTEPNVPVPPTKP